ncbi:MAG: superoxide dismutase [Planctomycetes bacterium]|nr:superoxide dismutase [Planctomycetota bacterium]
MKVVAIITFRSTGTPEATREQLKAEADQLWELHTAGKLREMYYRKDKPGGLLVFEIESLEAANEVLSQLPSIKLDLASVDCFPVGQIIPLEPHQSGDAES